MSTVTRWRHYIDGTPCASGPADYRPGAQVYDALCADHDRAVSLVTDADLARYEADARAELAARHSPDGEDRQLSTRQISDVLDAHGQEHRVTYWPDGEVQAWMECAGVHDHSGHAPDGWETVPTSLVDLLLWLGY